MTNRKSGKNFTFSLIALDPDNRLRYPPVSLFFMMCSWWRMVPEFQENLFDTQFAPVKVGDDGRFLAVGFWRLVSGCFHALVFFIGISRCCIRIWYLVCVLFGLV